MSDCAALPGGSADPLEVELLSALPRLRAHLSARRPRGSRAEVEDLSQEVVARALRYRASFDPARGVWPWLRRTADNVLRDQHIAAVRRPLLQEDLDPAAPARPEVAELRDEIARILAPLTSRERDVLIAFHQRGLSVRAIAEERSVPEGTIKSLLSRARKRLAGIAEAEGKGT